MARPKKGTEESLTADTAEKKETAATKKPRTKKADAVKEEAVKTEVSEAEAPKKPAAKKAAAKKAEEPEMTLTVQFRGKDIAAKDVMEAAKKAYTEANPDGEIKSIDIYVKPEENVAYYAVNGEGSEEYKIQL